jgi:hypothetical protein
LLVNLFSGVLIVFAGYNYGNKYWTTASEIGNIVPNFISVCFLIDALRRLKTVVEGVLHIETW